MKLAVLGGSLRSASLNRRLLDHLVRVLEREGHEAPALSGESLRLPLYDADLPVPAGALALQAALEGIQGLVIVSPEYNAGSSDPGSTR
jgi:chromate reductase